MKKWSFARGLAAGALVVCLLAMPAQAGESPSGRHIYAFRCSDNEQLRIMFNSEQRRAVVERIRRPNVTLQQADSNEGYRFTRGDDYELSGDLQQIRWRVGSAEPLVCNRGER